MTLDVLYHWSPKERRAEIQRDGLTPFSRPVVHSDPGLAAPYVCLSPTPARAWSLSGDMEWVSNIEEWDCWQVHLPDTAEVHVRPNHGPEIEEVKVYTAIAPDRLWLVGTREVPFFMEVI